MKKLLHERLRKAAKNGVSNIETYDENIVVRLSKDEELSLADEIEKYYIPRPRFEDGEPVQSSDMEEIGGLATCCVYTDGSWKFDPDKYEDERNPKPWDEQQGRQCDFIKRPEPKVLDADGVEIKVGCHAVMAYDKTWGKTISYVGTNARSDCRCPQKNARQEPFVVYEEGGWDYARNVICYEPDSLEKLRDDMREFVEAASPYPGRTKTHDWLARLTAIMERDA